VASHTKRVIRIKDGLIQNEGFQSPSLAKNGQAQESGVRNQESGARSEKAKSVEESWRRSLGGLCPIRVDS